MNAARRVVTAGLVLFATSLAIAATVTTSTGYGRLAIAWRYLPARADTLRPPWGSASSPRPSSAASSGPASPVPG